MSSSITTRIIRAFEGPRHDRLYAIWDAINEYDPDVNLEWFPNPNGWAYSHGEAFNAIWEDERNRPSRYLLLTESDFLPYMTGASLIPPNAWHNPGHQFEYHEDAAAIGVTYFTRDPDTKERLMTEVPGAWWILIDKEKAPQDLDFCGTPDPGNQLGEQFADAKTRIGLWPGSDCLKEPVPHYGVRYHFGEHLFWSRHLHDDPNLVVAGCRLGDIQSAHDRAVDAWIRRQPKDFQALLCTNYSIRPTTSVKPSTV